MDIFTILFWICSSVFFSLSAILLYSTNNSTVFYIQIIAGSGIFATSKIGRKFLGLE